MCLPIEIVKSPSQPRETVPGTSTFEGGVVCGKAGTALLSCTTSKWVRLALTRPSSHSVLTPASFCLPSCGERKLAELNSVGEEILVEAVK